ALPPGGMLVEYFALHETRKVLGVAARPDRLFAVTVAAEGCAARVYPLGELAPVERAVAAFRRKVSAVPLAELAEVREAGARLYRMVVAPWEAGGRDHHPVEGIGRTHV